MSAPYPDELRERAIELYKELGSINKVAERMEPSSSWVNNVCREAGVIEYEYPDWLAGRAQELINDGIPQREVARRLQKETGRDGPSSTWVQTNTETPDDRSFNGCKERSFEYNGRTIVIKGRHSIEKCVAALDAYSNDEVATDIAEEYDMPVGTVEGLIERAGIRRTPKEAGVLRTLKKGQISPIARRRQAEYLYTQEKLSEWQISDRLGVPRTTVQDDLDVRGVERRDKRTAVLIRRWGSLANYRRFCQRAAIMIRHRGETKKAACEAFGVCRETVNRALDHWDELKSREKEHFWNHELEPPSQSGGLRTHSFSPRRSGSR